MKIGFLCQQYPPMVNGPSLFTQRLAIELARRGHDILILTASPDGKMKETKEGNLTIVHLPSIFNPLRAGQRFMVFQNKKITYYLKRFNPDIFHLHDLLLCAPLAVHLSKHLNIPMTFTAHQLPWYIAEYMPNAFNLRTLSKNLMWMYAKWLIDHSEAVITPTETINKIIKTKIPCNPATISCGIDTNEFIPPPLPENERNAICLEFGLDPNQPIILYVGRIDKEKRVDLVLRAAAKVIHKIPAQVLIIGDGKQLKKLKALSRALGIEEDCCFPGFIHHEHGLSKFYRMASVFVMACEIETLGIVALEAASSGLPVIAPDASCMPEIVLDKMTGFLFPPGDTQKLSECILRVLENPQLAMQMSTAGCLNAKSHDSRLVIEAHEKLYLSMINSFALKHKASSKNKQLMKLDLP